MNTECITITERKAWKRTITGVSRKKTKKASKAKQAELSDKAKGAAQRIAGKYNNMDFMVIDYDSGEETRRYLSRGTT